MPKNEIVAVEKNENKFYTKIKKFFAGLFRRLLRMKVVNPQNEPADKNYIVCCNHTALLDVVVIAIGLKRQVNFMAKKELFKVPVLAPLIKLLGAFPIDRGGSDVGAIKTAVKLVSDGNCLGIFPQGHRYPGEDPRETKTKNGMALIACKTGADIVPTYIWRKKNRFKLFRRTYIIIGEPISFESLGYDTEASGEYARITGIVFDKICTLGEEFEAARKQKKEKKKR